MPEPTLPPKHDEIVELLPWRVNDTLSTEETRRVDDHLARCPSCRAARAAEERLAAALASIPESEAGLEAGLSRLRAELAREQRRGWLRRQPTRRQLLAAVLAQGIVLAGLLGLVAWLLRPAPRAQFHTLSVPGAVETAVAGPRLRLVVDPGMRTSELRRLLAAAGCRIVDGPTPAGVFTIEAEAGTVDQALATLRASAGVRLAEPVAAAP
ncbi:MAG: zf-HC2 domain-containing protein [Thermoanaerobaculia bacterium]